LVRRNEGKSVNLQGQYSRLYHANQKLYPRMSEAQISEMTKLMYDRALGRIPESSPLTESAADAVPIKRGKGGVIPVDPMVSLAHQGGAIRSRRKPPSQNSFIQRKKALSLAGDLMRSGKAKTRKSAMREAWKAVKGR